MKQKLLGLLTKEKLTFQYLSHQIYEVFGNSVKIDGLYLEQEEEKEKIQADVVVVSGVATLSNGKAYIKNNAKIILSERTLNVNYMSALFELLELPTDTKVLVISNTKEIIQSFIKRFSDLGIKHLEFIPYNYKTGKIPSNVKVGLIFGFPHHAPTGLKKLIDLGPQELDIKTLIDIKQSLNIETSTMAISSFRYMNALVKVAFDLVKSVETHKDLNKVLETVINSSDDGILVIDEKQNILLSNKVAEVFFNLLKNKSNTFHSIFGFKIENPIEDKVITLNNKKYILKSDLLDTQKKKLGHIVIIKEAKSIEKIEAKLREHMFPKSHKAKYDFEDIISDNKKMIELKKFAKEVAKSDFTIMIYGESGTGKELFAHAIHKNSLRKDNPFIPANVASLPGNLIESELFGYDEGAFTGAKKGGKLGLFELAHNGTIFLDEIGDLPLYLQSVLLRVIQEREVMRVGGTRIIPINTRIIAATNKDLNDLIRQNKFRQDLFYRLNVLPINVPPLRERPEDIEILLEHFLSPNGLSLDIFSKEILEYLQEYKWPGNIRELQNVCHYTTCIARIYGGNITKIEQYIYNYIADADANKKNKLIDDNCDFEYETILGELGKTGYLKEYVAILSELEKGLSNNMTCSKYKIYNNVKSKLNISFQQVKKRLEDMSEQDLIVSGKTKQGTRITVNGQRFLKYVKNNFNGVF